MLDHLGGALEHADLADARDVAAVPLHAELEVLAGSNRWALTVNWAMTSS
jgi:hypothetical protein